MFSICQSGEGCEILCQPPRLLLLPSSFLRQTSAASSRVQCSQPDPNSNLWIRVFPTGPPPQAPDQSVPRRASTASSEAESSLPDLNHKESPKTYQIECQNRMLDRMSEHIYFTDEMSETKTKPLSRSGSLEVKYVVLGSPNP